ncbi:acetoacetate decarboxylase family protein [Pseudorhodoplanes sp.]|uniref:acetoacetate decarboxylase family protein n=1 Tax=Pseudorhodoplanes sp. TaxID=1934341 RepID=UPI002BAC133F|nr:acetoacetate decarboxylase family protein [Pseudorhodoplanes sp.]HWV43193.1 acetoacetate decarboxylase family protein [Pseudorhodoplanes sp.]
MLHGYTVPLTPQGQSELTPPPPWHYSSDCIAVEYWADPAAVAALLPPGMEPDVASQGRTFFWFLDWQFTGSNDELTDPARYQYREAFVLIEARLDGKPVNFCPYIFVDNDSALARGWTQGYPKKLGSIFQTRTFSVLNAAAAPLAAGSRFGASVSAHDERLATARIQLEAPVANPATVFNRPTIIRRYFPQLTAGLRDKPAVDELTLSLMDDLSFTNVWSGSAELSVPEVRGEDMHRIAPLRVGRGYRFSMGYTVTDLPILKDYLA